MSIPRAIVTGAARGIGRATAQTLVARGFSVYAIDLDVTGLTQLHGELGELLIPVQLDLGDEPAIGAFGADLDDTIDLLVNNAGIGSDQPFFSMSTEQWRRVLAVDLTAAFLLSRACWPQLRKPGGAVVNVSSVHGSRPLAGQAAYAAAKGGLENLTRAMALDAAPAGVRVNAVAPGFVQTRTWEEWIPDVGQDAPSWDAWARHTIPYGQLGDAAQVAEAIAWLGDPAAGYVTGAVLSVDGALSARAYPPKEH